MTLEIDESALANFRAKYSGVHPLAFQRSLERAASAIELFEILESMPRPPFSWDDSKRSWVRDEDVMGVEGMKAMGRKRK